MLNQCGTVTPQILNVECLYPQTPWATELEEPRLSRGRDAVDGNSRECQHQAHRPPGRRGAGRQERGRRRRLRSSAGSCIGSCRVREKPWTAEPYDD
jgi:hypothetical protein